MIPESEYQKDVEAALVDDFGEEKVESERYFPRYERFADFVVYTKFGTLVVEVENNADEFMDGVGQAVMYSTMSRMSHGLVVTPPPEGEDIKAEIEVVSGTVPVIHVVPGYRE